MQHLSSNSWTRRFTAGLVFVSLLMLILAPLSACGGSSSNAGNGGGTVNLTFWSWVPNIKTSVDLFNQTHPGIHVTWDSVAAGNATYAKMFTAIKAHNAPDLGQVEYQLLPTFEATGGLRDISQYTDSSLKNKFVPWTWSQSTLGSAVYAIPQDTGPMGLYYRADLFKKYNIPVPSTWAQYADAAAKLHAANPNYYITDFPPTTAGWFIGLVWQAGGRWFHINGQSWKVAINDPSSQQVASYWQNLISKKLVRTDPDFSDAWYHDLQTGGAATWISAVWGAAIIRLNAPNTSGDWRVAPMPQWTAGQNVVGNWGGSTTVVFKDSQHPKEAAEFAQWLNTDPKSVELMIKGAALYPALQSELDSPTVNSPAPFFGNQVVNQTFHDASNKVDINFQWGPTMNQVFTDMGDNFSNVASGKSTMTDALNAVQMSTFQNMQKQGFNVQQ